MLPHKNLEKAKQLLGHPNFNKLTPEQIQQTFKVLLNSGLTKNDLTQILSEIEQEKKRFASLRENVSRLEMLPRNVFKHMVEVGQIKGKDLVHLCNSSPILKNYCLADSKDINGQVIEKEEIYVLALKKAMGKNYKPEISPSIDFVQLLETYIVIKQRVRADGLLGEREELFFPYLIRQISKTTPNTSSTLGYKGHVYINDSGRIDGLLNRNIDVSNIVKLATTENGTLMMDASKDLWYIGRVNRIEINGKYGDGSDLWNYDYLKPIKLPKTFSVLLNEKEGFIDREFEIKKITSDASYFYFLTKDGNLLQSIYPFKLGEEDRKGNFKKIYVKQIAEGVKTVQPDAGNGNILIIKYSGTIVTDNFNGVKNAYKLPTNAMPIKGKIIGNKLLVLDNENRLWEIGNGILGKVVETGIVDFDVYITANFDRIITEFYFVKPDGVVYRKFNLDNIMDEVFYNGKPIKKIKTLPENDLMHSVLMFSPVLE